MCDVFSKRRRMAAARRYAPCARAKTSARVAKIEFEPAFLGDFEFSWHPAVLLHPIETVRAAAQRRAKPIETVPALLSPAFY